MLAKAFDRDLEFGFSRGQIAASQCYFGHQLVRDCDVFSGLILRSYFQQPARVFAGPIQIALSQPVLAGARLKPNVVTPAKPGVTLEN